MSPLFTTVIFVSSPPWLHPAGIGALDADRNGRATAQREYRDQTHTSVRATPDPVCHSALLPRRIQATRKRACQGGGKSLGHECRGKLEGERPNARTAAKRRGRGVYSTNRQGLSTPRSQSDRKELFGPVCLEPHLVRPDHDRIEPQSTEVVGHEGGSGPTSPCATTFPPSSSIRNAFLLL